MGFLLNHFHTLYMRDSRVGVKTEMVAVKTQPTKEKGKVKVWMMVPFGFSYMYVYKVYSALISVMGSFTRLRSPLTVVIHLGFTI